MRRRAQERGYTLIELLVVLGILGLVTTVAMPVASQMGRAATLRSDCYRLMSALRHIQEEAVERQETITVEPATGGLKTTKGDTIALSESTSISFEDSLIFYPDGTTTGGHLTISNSSRNLRITVAWLTGDLAVDDR